MVDWWTDFALPSGTRKFHQSFAKALRKCGENERH